jgi:hypothetical protein
MHKVTVQRKKGVVGKMVGYEFVTLANGVCLFPNFAVVFIQHISVSVHSKRNRLFLYQ